MNISTPPPSSAPALSVEKIVCTKNQPLAATICADERLAGGGSSSLKPDVIVLLLVPTTLVVMKLLRGIHARALLPMLEVPPLDAQSVAATCEPCCINCVR